jgi:hypothetical protein
MTYPRPAIAAGTSAKLNAGCPHEMAYCACTYSAGEVLTITSTSPKLSAMQRMADVLASPQVQAHVVPAPSTSANERFNRWATGTPLPRSEYYHHAVVTGVSILTGMSPEDVDVPEPEATVSHDAWYEVWRVEPFLGEQYVDLVKGYDDALAFAQSRRAGQHVVRPLRITL